MTDKSITDRERLARLIAPTEWQFSVGAAGSLLLADRILAALPEMGWHKSSGVTLKHDDQLTGKGADIVREWRPRSDAETTGGD